jgi:cyclopropane fatty-acyl-phospholipid synthase-like methyltransferase
MASYDEHYARVDALFGREPEKTLRPFLDRLERGSLMLDFGAGQGRNALFLAEQGFDVHALEPSTVAAASIERAATSRDLRVEVFCSTFEDFESPVRDYAGVLVFGLIPNLDWDAIRALVETIEDRLGAKGLLWITGFTTEDPSYGHYTDSCESIGAHSFRTSTGGVRTYLEPGQILELFSSYSALHHWEGLGPEHRHGDGPLERHGRFEAVLQRPESPGA